MLGRTNSQSGRRAIGPACRRPLGRRSQSLAGLDRPMDGAGYICSSQSHALAFDILHFFIRLVCKNFLYFLANTGYYISKKGRCV